MLSECAQEAVLAPCYARRLYLL